MGKSAKPDPEPAEIRFLFEEIVSGFPLPVTLDDAELPRPDALDLWEGLRFYLPEGVALVKLDPAIYFDINQGNTFLQGFEISHSLNRSTPWPNFSRWGMRVIMHLSADQWRVRVPDRNALHESMETDEKIEAVQESRSTTHRLPGRGFGSTLIRS